MHAGLDLSRRKLDVCLLSEHGEHLDQLAVPPDVDSLRTLARRIDEVDQEPVCAVVESMTGARLVHDTLEQEGWSVEIADAQKVKGLVPLACKTDKIDSMVLAVLSHRDLVPAIWLPDPRVREERELAHFRLHLVKYKSALKCRIHSTLINFGRPCPVTDLFGAEGGESPIALPVAVDPQGRATVAWQRWDGANSRIEAVRLDAAGEPSTVRTLSEAGQNPSHHQVAVDPEGRATVVWRARTARTTASRRSSPCSGDLNLPAKLVIARAQVQAGASAAGRHDVRRLVVRGSLDPRAAGERVVMRFRARGRQIVVRPTVQQNGVFEVNRRLRGPQRRAAGGQLRVRYRGNDVLRAVGQRLRAARRAVRLRITRIQLQQRRLVVAGRVLPRTRRQARIQVEFNRPNGDPAQLATRARVRKRGRFRATLRVPLAVRNLGAWVSITHPGRARLHGQRRGRAVDG